MNITLKRIYLRDTYTIGAIQVDGKYMMDTLEPHAIDWTREKKTAGKTAIPPGRYRIQIAPSKTFKRRMPYLLDVPNFTGIMIHTGNTAQNTRGCILVGKAVQITDSDDGKDAKPTASSNAKLSQYHLTQSRIHFNRLFRLIEDAIDRGEAVWIRVL